MNGNEESSPVLVKETKADIEVASKEIFIKDKAEETLDFKKLHHIVKGINKTTLGSKVAPITYEQFESLNLPMLNFGKPSQTNQSELLLSKNNNPFGSKMTS